MLLSLTGLQNGYICNNWYHCLHWYQILAFMIIVDDDLCSSFCFLNYPTIGDGAKSKFWFLQFAIFWGHRLSALTLLRRWRVDLLQLLRSFNDLCQHCADRIWANTHDWQSAVVHLEKVVTWMSSYLVTILGVVRIIFFNDYCYGYGPYGSYGHNSCNSQFGIMVWLT